MKKTIPLIWIFLVPFMVSACLKNLPSENRNPIQNTPAEEQTASGQTALSQTESTVVSDQPQNQTNQMNILLGSNTLPAGTTFDNPWDYCKAVGTINTPGSEYIGKSPNDEVTESVLQAMGIDLSEASNHITIWRCANGQVWGCDSSSYPQCPELVDFSTQPSEIIQNECAKPGMENVTLPGAVTGYTTAYEWTCKSGVPQITGQGVTADEFGFNANIWFPVIRLP